MRKILFCLAAVAAMHGAAQKRATITLDATAEGEVIPREIYGQFAEHLGTCIYGGLWVGEGSEIANTDGYRTDVLNALKALQVPVLRWPGGCFADEYHWMDGIGPRESRPTLVNNNWGGTVEDNSFGTHEFLNLCELLGCEPYISGNVGSGTVEELAKWVEYMTSEDGSPMAKLRKENGRERAWKVKFLGVGNESWGCGGSMRPEYYADLYRRYATYCRNYDGNRLYKVASGASDYDYNWTRVLMSQAGSRMNAISLHYYTVTGWRGSKGAATQFDEEQYYWTLGKCREVGKVIEKHIAIMDELDPQGRVDLLLDEWGTWWDEEPGTIHGHLYQQNTLRDAMVAALSFDLFHQYTRRLKMCNIAQIVNVLQSMILTKGSAMVLTPTYHLFRMYNVHQGAVHLPLDIACEETRIEGGYLKEECVLPMLSATASRDANDVIHISLSNVDLSNAQTVRINLAGVAPRQVTGEILTADDIAAHNTFEQPDRVKPTTFTDVTVARGYLVVELPAKSIVTLTLN